MRVDISVANHHYHIVIKDDGPSIPVNMRETLFKKDTGFDYRDKGIAFYLSRLIIESHGGTIELSETPGTQFIVGIPTSSYR